MKERIVQILVGKKCLQKVGEICKADKGVLQETVEWSHDFDRMIGRVLFCCSWKTFKMSTSELLYDQSKHTKIIWICFVFCPEAFYHHWSSGLQLIHTDGVREELSWEHINQGIAGLL